jgi:hypothetical protein
MDLPGLTRALSVKRWRVAAFAVADGGRWSRHS